MYLFIFNQFITSQFDWEPYKITITGSAKTLEDHVNDEMPPKIRVRKTNLPLGKKT